MWSRFYGVSKLAATDGHVEVGPIQKLDLEAFGCFLGGYQIRQGDVRDGWLTAHLPFLALRILQSLGALEDGTHLGMLPECGTQHESLEGRIHRNRFVCMVA
jgi:hypothetical protein